MDFNITNRICLQIAILLTVMVKTIPKESSYFQLATRLMPVIHEKHQILYILVRGSELLVLSWLQRNYLLPHPVICTFSIIHKFVTKT